MSHDRHTGRSQAHPVAVGMKSDSYGVGMVALRPEGIRARILSILNDVMDQMPRRPRGPHNMDNDTPFPADEWFPKTIIINADRHNMIAVWFGMTSLNCDLTQPFNAYRQKRKNPS